MYDTIIRGGSVADGRGGEPYAADVAIKDGQIAEIGTVSARAHEVIDASGALVTPGFIDIHTHYDGQFLWDDRIDPSFSHGVTTAIAGNCGVGFAPVLSEYRQKLLELMEGVEDIPGVVLDEGLEWNWKTFPDYLDRLASRRYTMSIASQLTHAPVRVFVMGERALRHEAATREDIDRMADIVREAMAAGAFGFSNGRLTTHLSSRGDQVPGTFAEDEELLALAKAMGSSGRGVFQILPKGANGGIVAAALTRADRLDEHRRIEAIARVSGRPVTYTVAEFSADPDDLYMMLDATRKANAEGLRIRPQMSSRGLGSIHMLDSYHVFLRRPSYLEIAHLPRAERAAALRDSRRRAAILSEGNVDTAYVGNPAVLGMLNRLDANLAESYILTDVIDFEPTEERKVAKLAADAGKSTEELIYDHYASGDGSNFNVGLWQNYARGSLDHIRKAFLDPNVVSGLADGGAHVRIICDGSAPTFQLCFWVRDRTRGEKLPLGHVVRKLTSEPADLHGLNDRGVIAVGKRADLNVIDFQRLSLKPPEIVHDLPSGAGRLHQKSVGYLATLVGGVLTRQNDCDTGARPGRLVRSTQIPR